MIVLRVEGGANAKAVLEQVKLAAKRFPGTHRLQIVVSPLDGRDTRSVRLGQTWRYDASEACLAALREFGAVEVTP